MQYIPAPGRRPADPCAKYGDLVLVFKDKDLLANWHAYGDLFLSAQSIEAVPLMIKSWSDYSLENIQREARDVLAWPDAVIVLVRPDALVQPDGLFNHVATNHVATDPFTGKPRRERKSFTVGGNS